MLLEWVETTNSVHCSELIKIPSRLKAIKDLLLTLLVEIIQISVHRLLQLYVRTQYRKHASCRSYQTVYLCHRAAG